MPSNHLILCRPLLLLPSVFPSIRVFSNESALCIREQYTTHYMLYYFAFFSLRDWTWFEVLLFPWPRTTNIAISKSHPPVMISFKSLKIVCSGCTWLKNTYLKGTWGWGKRKLDWHNEIACILCALSQRIKWSQLAGVLLFREYHLSFSSQILLK